MSMYWTCIKTGTAAISNIVPVSPWILSAYIALHPLPANCDNKCHYVIPVAEFQRGGMFYRPGYAETNSRLLPVERRDTSSTDNTESESNLDPILIPNISNPYYEPYITSLPYTPYGREFGQLVWDTGGLFELYTHQRIGLLSYTADLPTLNIISYNQNNAAIIALPFIGDKPAIILPDKIPPVIIVSDHNTAAENTEVSDILPDVTVDISEPYAWTLMVIPLLLLMFTRLLSKRQDNSGDLNE